MSVYKLQNGTYKADIISRIDNWSEIKSLRDFDDAYEGAKIMNLIYSTRALLEMDKETKTELYKFLKGIKKKKKK